MESVAAQSLEAGQMAAQLAGAAAKSLFSFATSAAKSSIKTIVELTDSAGSQSLKLNHQTVLLKRLLAEGGFGSVYLASSVNNTSGAEFALKKLNCQSREQLEEANEELAALQRFGDCEHIIRLLDYAVHKAQGATLIYMLFPLYEIGTTWDLVERALAEDSARWPFSQVRRFLITGVMVNYYYCCC
jgi:hypothetical protein